MCQMILILNLLIISQGVCSYNLYFRNEEMSMEIKKNSLFRVAQLVELEFKPRQLLLCFEKKIQVYQCDFVYVSFTCT